MLDSGTNKVVDIRKAFATRAFVGILLVIIAITNAEGAVTAVGVARSQCNNCAAPSDWQTAKCFVDQDTESGHVWCFRPLLSLGK
jgi:hypothetical protein